MGLDVEFLHENGSLQHKKLASLATTRLSAYGYDFPNLGGVAILLRSHLAGDNDRMESAFGYKLANDFVDVHASSIGPLGWFCKRKVEESIRIERMPSKDGLVFETSEANQHPPTLLDFQG